VGGFSLLEVMVAMAILATAFTAVLKLHSDAMDMVIAGRTRTQGAELAQYKLTEIELGGLESLKLESGEFGEIAPQYAWKVEFEPTPLASWTKVTVTVNNTQLRKGGEFRLTTYLLTSKPDEEGQESTK
jgi:prepilin-type N-terminal cleavage/methylation domain-containing protein